MVAAPITPLSWWMHAPRSSTGSPLMRSPRAGSTSMVRIPNVVDAASSSCSVCVERAVRHVYEVGDSTLHRRGGATKQALPQRLGAPREHGERSDVARDDRCRVVDDLGRHRGGRRDQRLVLDDAWPPRPPRPRRRPAASSPSRRRARAAPVRRPRDAPVGRSPRRSTSGRRRATSPTTLTTLSSP